MLLKKLYSTPQSSGLPKQNTPLKFPLYSYTKHVELTTTPSQAPVPTDQVFTTAQLILFIFTLNNLNRSAKTPFIIPIDR